MAFVAQPAEAAPARVSMAAGPIAVAALLGAWLAFAAPFFAGKVLYPVDIPQAHERFVLGLSPTTQDDPWNIDAYDLYYPWRVYLGQRLAKGHFPLWDPYRFGGAPFAANNQTAVFYPPNWAYAFGDTLQVYGAITLLSMLAGLLLAYWFLRVVSLHPYASALGAIVFVFSGFLTAWRAHTTFQSTAIWLPLALGGLETALRGRPRRGIPLASVGLALAVLGGQSLVAAFVWLATGVWGLVSGLWLGMDELRKSWRLARRALAKAASLTVSALALGAGLCSLQLLSTVELSQQIARQKLPYEALIASSIPPVHLLTALVGYRLGHPVDGNYAGAVNFSETALYAGAFVVVLGLFALLLRPRRATVAFAAIASVGLLSAFGSSLYRFLADLPPFDRLPDLPRFVFLFDVGAAGLAAVGLDAVLRGGRRYVLSLLLAAGVVIAGIIGATSGYRHAFPIPSEYLTPKVLRAAAVVATSTALGLAALVWGGRRSLGGLVSSLGILAVLTLDLWTFGYAYSPFHEPAPVYPLDPVVQRLRAVEGTRPRIARFESWWLPPNAGLAYGLYDIQGRDSFVLARIAQLAALADGSPPTTGIVDNFKPKAFRSPVLDLLGVRTVVAPKEEPFRAPKEVAGKLAVFTRPGALPPAFVTPCWEKVAAGNVLSKIGSMPTSALRATAVVDDDAPARASLAPAFPGPCRPTGAARVVAYEPERVVVDADTAAPAVLVLTDAWYPGWKAEVDGRPAPILRTDWALRGVPIPAGSHRIVMTYRPRWVPVGVALTVFSLLVALAWALGISPPGGPRRRDRRGT